MKPMLATSVEFDQVQYPAYVSPKLDGIRTVIHEGKAKSRTLKLIPNEFIQASLLNHGWEGMDGELIVGSRTAPDVFSQTTSGVMSVAGQPKFTYWVFDLWCSTAPYEERLRVLNEFNDRDTVKILPQTLVHTPEGLRTLEDSYLQAGYEGTMIRDPKSPYKYGRSTLRQGYLLKRKPLADAEGIVVGFEYLRVNMNEAETNDVGYTQRSSAQAGRITDYDRLGAMIVTIATGPFAGVDVKIGTGFTQEQRQKLAQMGTTLLGELVTFTYQAEGAKDKPRFPSFKGFRKD